MNAKNENEVWSEMFSKKAVSLTIFDNPFCSDELSRKYVVVFRQ